MGETAAKLRAMEEQVLADLGQAADLEALKALEVSVLGRKGQLTAILRTLGSLDPEERRTVGQEANLAKGRLAEAIEARREALEQAALDASLSAERVDPTQPGPVRLRGHEHPLRRAQRELADLFGSMGFDVLDGPEVETEFFNFDALNTPSWHPARDMQDTMWLDQGCVLRTHTSGMQVRSMQERGAPLRVVAIGRVFRNEMQDASHEHTFHQLEGLVVDEGISIGHLKGTLDALLQGIFGGPVKSRLRPAYFPFVEPGLELDFECRLCAGAGCRTCKGSGWVELLGCGMVHPRVLQAGRVDPERYSGFAFGMGIERLTMMRHAIPDIRFFQSGDLRFLEQF